MRTTVRQRWLNLFVPLLFAFGLLLVTHTLMSTHVSANNEVAGNDAGGNFMSDKAAPYLQPSLSSTAVVVVPYLSTGYRYLVVPTGGGPSGFEQPDFDDSSFSTSEAGFGTIDGGCPLNNSNDVQTTWSLNTDILVRKEFTLPPSASNLKVNVAIDNDIQVFINGYDISGGLQTHDGCASRDSFTFSAPDNVLT